MAYNICLKDCGRTLLKPMNQSCLRDVISKTQPSLRCQIETIYVLLLSKFYSSCNICYSDYVLKARHTFYGNVNV